MADKDNNITTRYKVDISELKSQFTEASRLIRLANSEFKAATSGMDDWSKSSDGLTAKLKQLGDKLGAQKTQLHSLEEQYKLVCKEQGENSAGAEELKIKINNQKAAIGQTESEMRKYDAELQKVKSGADDTSNSADDLSGSLEDTGKAADNSAKGGLANFASALAGAVADAVVFAIGKLKDLATEAISVGKQFDASMSEVKAISKATGEEYDSLRAKAKQMGETTKFTASQTADAFSYMAMAGWKTTDMLDGIDGVLNLAAASNTDLATTSDIVTDALTAFGKSAKDAGRLADIMAAASSNANTNVELMGETFKYVAPLAGSLGYEMEDTAVAVGLMANAGIKGTQAGTSLRSIITRMTAPTKESGEAMAALGLSIEKTNADGTKSMKSLSETVSDLRSVFGEIRIPVDEFNKKLAELEASQASLDEQFEAGEITESDYKQRTKNIAEAQATLMDRAYGAEGALKAQYASMIAGKNALSGFMALVNSSDEDFEKLTDAISNSTGAAQEMADTMMDNLEGDLTKLSSAFEGFELTLYEKFTTPLRDIVQAVTNDVIPALTDLINGVAGAADRVGAALSDIVSNILDKLVDALPQAIDVVMSLVTSLGETLLEMSPKLVDVVAQIINKQIQATGEQLKKWFEAIKRVLPDLIDSLLDALPMFIDTLTTLARDLAAALPDIIKDIADALPDTVKKIAAVLSEQFDVLLGAAIDIFTALIEAIPEVLPGLIDAVISMVGSIGDALTDALPKILDAAITLFEAVVDAIPKILPLIAKTLPDIINTVVKFLTKNAPTIAKAGVKLFMAILDALPVIIGALAPEIPKIIDAIVHTLLDSAPAILDAFIEIFGTVKTAVTDFISRAPEWLEGILEPINDYLIEPVKNAFSELFDWLGGLSVNEIISDFFMECEETISAFFSWASEKIEGVKEMFAAAWGAIKAVWDFVAPYFKGVWENIKATFEGTKKVLGSFFSAAWDYITGVWDVAKTYFKTIWENIKAVFSVVKTVLGGFFKAAWTAIKAVWDNVVNYFKTLWDNIKLIFSVVEKVFKGDFSGAWEAVKKIWDNCKGYFSGVWNNVKNIFATVKDYFESVFSSAWNAIKNIFSNVGDFFGNVWNIIKEKFTSIGTKIGDAIGGAFKTAINSVLATVENGLNAVPRAINNALDLINELPGVDISKMSEISLPRLARGGVLKRGQLGLLEGSGAEAVVPLEKNTEWLDEIAKRLYNSIIGTPGGVGSPVQSVTNNFYQTNNSPKALSRLEIYRQSKNLLRMQGAR